MKIFDRLVPAELFLAFKYIFIVGLSLWLPSFYLLSGLDFWPLFNNLKAFIAAIMFFSGAVIANATAVGGGIVFNPLLQLVFGVSGFSALILAITVQCAGMPSGTYGWFRKGEYGKVLRRDLLVMALSCIFFTTVFTLLFLSFKKIFPTDLLKVMKIASALVSFYVFVLLWKEIKEEKSKEIGPSSEYGKQAESSVIMLRVDWRIYPWLAFGALLNVFTAVGVGELTFAHIIKYYKAPAKRAVAIGTMMQAISVLTQTLFNLIFLRDYLIVHLVWIGLLFTMTGGRLAPFIITRQWIEPYVKHALAATALAMGLTSLIMLLFR